MDHDCSILKAAPAAVLPKPGTPLWLSLRRDRLLHLPAAQPGNGLTAGARRPPV